MEENDSNKNKVPTKMATLAWPKSKYGLYVATFIIIIVLLILDKFSIIFFSVLESKELVNSSKTRISELELLLPFLIRTFK